MTHQRPSPFEISSRHARALILSLGMATAFLSAAEQPQNQQAAAPASTASATKAEPVAPRYSATDLERAFNFMDSNHDDKLSREEAIRFPGVTKYFDRADTDADGFLSRDEFDKAMNYVKPK